jgi:hypothetical protein
MIFFFEWLLNFVLRTYVQFFFILGAVVICLYSIFGVFLPICNVCAFVKTEDDNMLQTIVDVSIPRLLTLLLVTILVIACIVVSIIIVKIFELLLTGSSFQFISGTIVGITSTRIIPRISRWVTFNVLSNDETHSQGHFTQQATDIKHVMSTTPHSQSHPTLSHSLAPFRTRSHSQLNIPSNASNTSNGSNGSSPFSNKHIHQPKSRLKLNTLRNFSSDSSIGKYLHDEDYPIHTPNTPSTPSTPTKHCQQPIGNTGNTVHALTRMSSLSAATYPNGEN